MAAANSPFGFPLQPEYAGNAYDIQTKQALAQALLQKGLQGNLSAYAPAGGGYQYVPKMGIGGALANALAPMLGIALQKQANQELTDLGQQQGAALQRLLTPQTTTEQVASPAPQVQPGAVSPGSFGLGPDGGFTGGSPNVGNAVLANALAPQAQTVTRTTAAPLNPAGLDPTMARYAMQMAPDKYMEHVLSYSKPADIISKIRAAGIDPNSPLGQQLAQSNLAKENYIAPLAGGPGTVYRNPNNPNQVLASNPMIETGQEVLGYTPEGRPIIASMIGAEGSARGLAGAKALGTASAEPVTGVDESGRPTFSNKAAVAQGQTGSPSNVATGRFGGYQAPGGGFRPSLSAAEQTSYSKMGEQNQAAYNNLQSQASGAADRSNMLSAIEAYAAGSTNFGPGWEKRMENLAAINSKLPSGFQFNSDSAANAQIVQKYASNLIQNYQKTMGGSGSDKQMEMVMHGTPGSEMYNKAILEVAPKLRGMEAAMLAKTDAADAWVAKHGNNTANFNQFETMWRQNYDPRIYQMAVMEPAQRGAFLMQQKDSAALKDKLQNAMNNGWIK